MFIDIFFASKCRQLSVTFTKYFFHRNEELYYLICIFSSDNLHLADFRLMEFREMP